MYSPLNRGFFGRSYALLPFFIALPLLSALLFLWEFYSASIELSTIRASYLSFSSHPDSQRPWDPFESGYWTDDFSEMIIYSIFAGRSDYLKIQVRYLKRLLDLGIINTVHMWDFCRDHHDSRYLQVISRKDHRFQVMKLVDKAGKVIKARRKEDWSHILFPKYYQYYAEHLGSNDILIKADDDIVYIENLGELLTWFKGTVNVTMAIPQIINNDFIAYRQLKEHLLPRSPQGSIYAKPSDVWRHDVLSILNKLNRMKLSPHDEDHKKEPLTNWYRCSSCARFAHDAFLSDRSRFESNNIYLWSSPTRFSINFVVLKGSSVIEYFKDWESLAKGDIDEIAITWRLQKSYNTTNAVFMNTVVAHYSFKPQKGLSSELLRRYEELSEIDSIF